MINPLLLWFLPLAAVPIVLHLIARHRLQTVELSTYRFLLRNQLQQRSKLKILEWLVLLLRILFVALVVMMLARPVVETLRFLAFGAEGGRDVHILIDASPSMSVRSGSTSSLQRAQHAASTIVSMLGREDHVTLVRAGQQPEVIYSGFVSEAQPAIDAIEAVTLDGRPARLENALHEVLLSRPRGPRIAYLVSDGNATAWDRLDHADVLKDWDSRTQLVLLDVGPTDQLENLALAGTSTDLASPIVGLPLLMTANIVSSAGEKPQETTLSVYLDDELLQQTKLTLEPEERRTVPLTLLPPRPGAIHGRLELSPDGFADDNRFLFTVNAESKLKVLIVTSSTNAGTADNPALFLRSALRAPLRARTNVTIERALAEALKIETIPAEQLSAEQIADADTVILADAKLDGRHAELLRRYVESGGGLIIFPGPQTNAQFYTERLLTHRLGPLASRPAATLHAPTGDLDDPESFHTLGDFDSFHPIFAAFKQSDDPFFDTVAFYRTHPITPTVVPMAGSQQTATSGAAVSLATTGSGDPLLIEAGMGEGRILLAGFAATPNWSNLPLKPEFVPLLLRSVARARRPADAAVPATVAQNTPAVVRIADRLDAPAAEITAPDGQPGTLELFREGDAYVGAYRQTEAPGYYDLQVRARNGERLALGFAVNPPVQRSPLQRLTPEEMQEIFADVEPTYLGGDPDNAVVASQLGQRREIWRTVILALFVIILTEFTLATLSSKPAEKRAAPGLAPAQEQGWAKNLVQRIRRAA